MRVVMIGPPGAGKGTQSARLAKRLKIPHLSTGEMLRAAIDAGTEIGRQVAPIMNAGHLVSDDLIAGVVEERIQMKDCRSGYLLDGFPRTLNQGEIYQTYLNQHGQRLDHVIELKVNDEELRKRLGARHDDSDNPRHDDKPDAVPLRIEVYHSETSPLVGFYKAEAFGDLLKVIDGIGTMDEITQRILTAIGFEQADEV
ncbi:MAG: adenylate kinase [Planctomycetaceae bacterium]|nr:adenylate kinase [Planctomycetaceae bacterium]MCP4462818.1 adenylate kinase [Planctomycetaceae bacterium]MDG1808070.1 adenylate kinase [Pirellulaceae bacterium]MDG2102133.1 adenylate kinase [Pirellulaceae bacterium]